MKGTPVVEGVKMGVNLHAHRNNLRTLVLGGCRETLPAGERRVFRHLSPRLIVTQRIASARCDWPACEQCGAQADRGGCGH